MSWPGGARFWFWQGVQVPRDVVEAPDSLSAASIHSEPNVELRRIMLNRFGRGRFLRAAGARMLDEGECGMLWRVPSFALEDLSSGDAGPYCVLELVNSSEERDGSRRRYYLRVPPEMETARAAVGWTFGLHPDDYHPSVET